MTVITGAYPSTLFQRMTDLATCLCAQIEADGLPPFCFCGVVPGEAAILDYAGDCDPLCGMAWVRLAGAYPSMIVGAPDVSLGNCGAALGGDIEIGTMRCVPGSDDSGNPPSDAELLLATSLQIADAEAIRKAIICCPGHKDFTIGQYTPVGPAGGMVGGAWLLSVQVM